MIRPRAAALLVGASILLLLLAWLAGERRGSGNPLESTPGEQGTDRVRVEVLNAAGIPGLARRATERLRDSGFDVVYFGNSSSFGPDSSLVVDRAGKLEVAQAVARAVEISTVRSEPDPSLYLEATVVLGRDWSGAASDSGPDTDASAEPEGATNP